MAAIKRNAKSATATTGYVATVYRNGNLINAIRADMLKEALISAGEDSTCDMPEENFSDWYLDNNHEFVLDGQKISLKANDNVIMQDIAKNYQKKGLKPYILPVGGSTPLGNLGYVKGVLELIYQANQMNIKIDNIVVTAGSCGTIAGILTGLKGFNYQTKTLGITIGKSKAECVNRILSLNTEMVGLLGENFKINSKDIIIYDQYVGEGYGKKNIESIEAIQLTLEKEGILLDPVYTGKTMAGLIDLINKNSFQSDENIVFFHTGGYGGVFGHNDYFI